MIPLEIIRRITSERLLSGMNWLATGSPRAIIPWKRKVPSRTWKIAARLGEAPPISTAATDVKPIIMGPL